MRPGDGAAAGPAWTIERGGALQPSNPVQPAAGVHPSVRPGALGGRAHRRPAACPGGDPRASKHPAARRDRQWEDRGLHGRGRRDPRAGPARPGAGAGDLAHPTAPGPIRAPSRNSAGGPPQPAHRAGAGSAVVEGTAGRGGRDRRQPLGRLRSGASAGPDRDGRGGLQRVQAGPDAAIRGRLGRSPAGGADRSAPAVGVGDSLGRHLPPGPRRRPGPGRAAPAGPRAGGCRRAGRHARGTGPGQSAAAQPAAAGGHRRRPAGRGAGHPLLEPPGCCDLRPLPGVRPLRRVPTVLGLRRRAPGARRTLLPLLRLHPPDAGRLPVLRVPADPRARPGNAAAAEDGREAMAGGACPQARP